MTYSQIQIRIDLTLQFSKICGWMVYGVKLLFCGQGKSGDRLLTHLCPAYKRNFWENISGMTTQPGRLALSRRAFLDNCRRKTSFGGPHRPWQAERPRC
jgi:hypothetical protein